VAAESLDKRAGVAVRRRFIGVLLLGTMLAAPAFADGNDRAVMELYRKAGAAEQRGRTDDAIAAYGGIIQLRPADADAWRDRAFSYAGKKDYTNALNDYAQALKLQPGDARAHVDRGNVYAAMGNFPGALADFDAAIRANPDYTGALTAKSAVYDYQHNFDGAIGALDQLVKMQPQNAEFYNGRCWERAKANRDMKIAEGDCNMALKLSADKHFAAGVHDSRGFVYFRQARFAEAIVEFNAALAIEPRSGETIFRRGLAKAASHDAAGGKADVAAALAMDPQSGDEMASVGIKP
jgi:tetratricopeptide (TPR) repeat protein